MSISVRPRNRPIEINPGLVGATVTNRGPDTVYYGGPNVTTADGTSIAAGSSATLTGSTYLVVADSATLAKVTVETAAPSGDRSTYTQTYSTALRTVPNATVAAAATTSATNSSPYGFAQAQADAIPTNINALAVDVLALKKVITGLIDDLQAAGIVL